jgi:hypothetical protein
MITARNFLPDQYRSTNQIEINHNYLSQQFADHDLILEKIREVVLRGDFTLGTEVDRLESEFAALAGAKHAIGVGSGTDALFLGLKALGIDKGRRSNYNAIYFLRHHRRDRYSRGDSGLCRCGHRLQHRC